MSESIYNKEDSVWVEGKVIDSWSTGVRVRFEAMNPGKGGIEGNVSNIQVKKHIPAPIEIGCRVSYGNSRVWNGRVVAIDGNFAWVKWDEDDTNSGGVYSLSSLNKFCRRINFNERI